MLQVVKDALTATVKDMAGSDLLWLQAMVVTEVQVRQRKPHRLGKSETERMNEK